MCMVNPHSSHLRERDFFSSSAGWSIENDSSVIWLLLEDEVGK